MKALKLSGYTKNTAWRDLQWKKIHNKNVILSNYGDIHPFEGGPIFTCENLMLDGCNKNFLAYWLDKQTFPFARQVYIYSHPCDYYVLNRNFEKIYLHETFQKYKDRWWSKCDNIEIIQDSEYMRILKCFDREDINMS